MEKLSRMVREIVMIEGACESGITTIKTLEGGPPSSDLVYVLPHAKSAVTFAVAIEPGVIPPYLMKQDRLAMEKELVRVNVVASGIALHLANFLTQKGYPSVAVAANNVFRPPDAPSDYIVDLYYPDIAHRYLAVRSGVGHMGLSGNVITRHHGAAVIFGTMVTTAELLPTPPLPAEENYCDNCNLCIRSCAAGFMHRKEKTTVSLGGHEITYSKRRNYGRCDPVCSGFTGLHPSGKWSTWSPGRFAIPASNDDLQLAYERMQTTHGKWPAAPGGRYFFSTENKLRVSCANCQLVCAPDKNERKARYKMLTESGVIVQHVDGSLEAVSPQVAEKRLSSMPDDRRALYEDR